MKLNRDTLKILENFSKINSSIIIPEGNILYTRSPSKTIKAVATVTTHFPKKFCIYDLTKFLSVLSLFNEPDLDFYDNYVDIHEDAKSIKYMFASEDLIIGTTSKKIIMPSVDVPEIAISYQDLKSAQKAAMVLGCSYVGFVCDGENLSLQALNEKNPSSDVFSIFLGQHDKKFKALFKVENLRLLEAVFYKVEICNKGLVHFYNEIIDYYITVDALSSFDD